MNTDLALYLIMIVIASIGFALGRYERKDSYVKGYKRGIEIGKRIGNER